MPPCHPLITHQHVKNIRKRQTFFGLAIISSNVVRPLLHAANQRLFQAISGLIVYLGLFPSLSIFYWAANSLTHAPSHLTHYSSTLTHGRHTSHITRTSHTPSSLYTVHPTHSLTHSRHSLIELRSEQWGVERWRGTWWWRAAWRCNTRRTRTRTSAAAHKQPSRHWQWCGAGVN